MREIRVTKELGTTYGVLVGEKNFSVTVGPVYKEELVGADVTDEKLIEASFKFILDRESVDSILKTFDLQAIEKYFPEYKKEITQYIEKG